MRTIVLYIAICLGLCFGVKTQAQTLVTEYSSKLSSLPEIHAKLLNGVLNGAPSSIYVNQENVATLFKQPEQYYPRMMLVTKPSDLDVLAQAYPDYIGVIEVINIEWNGTDVFEISNDFVSKLTDSNLQYIYIRSYQNLSKSIIESSFQQLITQVNNLLEDVEILYSTMKHEQ